METKKETPEIDVLHMLRLLLEKWWIIVICAVVAAVGALVVTECFVTPTYKSSIKMYVNNNSGNTGSPSGNISSNDLAAAQKLVNTYIVVLKTRVTLDEVIAESGVDISYEALRNKISASAVNSTEVFEIVVTDTDPERAEIIANTIAKVLPDKISGIVEGSSVKVVDNAVAPSSPASPNLKKNVILGFLVGLVIAVAVIVIADLADPYIKDEEYISANYDLPILAVIPIMNGESAKGSGKSWGYYRKHRDYYGELYLEDAAKRGESNEKTDRSDGGKK